MKKKILQSIFVTGFIATILASVLTLYAFYGFFVKQTKNDLRINCDIIKSSIELLPDNVGYLKAIEDSAAAMRLTLIDPSGKVAFDSNGNLQSMPNHNDRREVAQARKSGFGEETRRSDTVGKDTIYYAFLLNDGYVLRGSQNLDNIESVFFNILPIIFGITIVLLLISVLIAKLLTKRLMKPIDSLTIHVADSEEPQVYNLNSQDYYDELTPLVNKIDAQHKKIDVQIASLRKERDTIQTITDNMQEGLIFVDKQGKILSVNKSAVAMLGGNIDISYVGNPIFSLINDDKLVDKLGRVLKYGDRIDTTATAASAATALAATKPTEFVVNSESNDKQCRFFINPVYESEVITGAIMLVLDITDIYKAEIIRREFSSNVSHELKTPLTSISGFAEMIENGLIAKQSDSVKFAGKIHKEATRLITLIDDIIRLTEIEEQQPIEMVEIELLSECKIAAENLAFTAKEKGVELIVQGQVAPMRANYHMIAELLYNLMDNAIKYNKSGGKVIVTVEKTKAEKPIKLTVYDNGIGIPQEDQARIFERFYRVDKSRSKQNGGTGLGLSIVKHIALYHHADIHLESKENVSTTITVEFYE